MTNDKIYTIKITRHELCDLLLATIAASECSDGAKKWSELRETLKAQLEKQDEKNGWGVYTK